MNKKVLVVSLGGSLIVPEKIDLKFLKDFKKTLEKNYKTHKFVIVCGGGTVARKYISIVKEERKDYKELSLAGIKATRTNAEVMMQFFGKKESNDKLPMNMNKVKEALEKNSVVICGALRYTPNATSDTTSAKLAHLLKSNFINITNIKGLYSDNPSKNKNAKFIPKESWRSFERRTLKIKHTPGQHFVLDQEASTIIRKNKIKTYIIGPNAKNLDNLIKNKKFIGTTISG